MRWHELFKGAPVWVLFLWSSSNFTTPSPCFYRRGLVFNQTIILKRKIIRALYEKAAESI
ncbi:hypothetical protein BXA22_02410 [Edwardsiella piscicida]|nr:hypothetical protein BXA22_02410 [Edwardsiella piscicida]QBB11354.1 hypothetical protein EVK84_01740 [Edwardsiella piscicida]